MLKEVPCGMKYELHHHWLMTVFRDHWRLLSTDVTKFEKITLRGILPTNNGHPPLQIKNCPLGCVNIAYSQKSKNLGFLSYSTQMKVVCDTKSCPIRPFTNTEMMVKKFPHKVHFTLKKMALFGFSKTFSLKFMKFWEKLAKWNIFYGPKAQCGYQTYLVTRANFVSLF